MVRYCSDWKPDDGPRISRNSMYSDGVSVSSTDHISVSWRRMFLQREKIFWHSPESVGTQVRDRRLELVDHQLHPQLGDLVLDDEQQLVVVRRVGQALLRRQQRVQLQVARNSSSARTGRCGCPIPVRARSCRPSFQDSCWPAMAPALGPKGYRIGAVTRLKYRSSRIAAQSLPPARGAMAGQQRRGYLWTSTQAAARPGRSRSHCWDWPERPTPR